MKVIFLHGPPAVGKLTIARELAALTGWRLFHNHLTVDLALSVYDFGTPGFVAVREEIWFAVFRRALIDGPSHLIFTFNPENTVPQRFIDELFRVIHVAGSEVISVELAADEAELERRLDSASRHEYRKLVDLALYRELRDARVFTSPVLPPSQLKIDTARFTPAAAAGKIAAFVRDRERN